MLKWHVILLVPVVVGCGNDLVEVRENSSTSAGVEPDDHKSNAEPQPLPLLRPLDDVPELERVFAITDRIYSGSEPHGEAAFAALNRLGIRAVVSVDGAPPDLETARQHGLRYIHIPIGYDGIPDLARRSLERVVREIEGPIYIHCHHGRHRGPAAAAIACIASGAATPDSALEILTRAETGKQYQGLWRDVANYVPTRGDTTNEPILVEQAEVESMAIHMARIGRAFDKVENLTAQDGWEVNAGLCTEVAAHAVLIREGFAEALRGMSDSKKAELAPEYMAWLNEFLATATKLETTLADHPNNARDLLASLRTQCQRCHASYRNH